MKKPAKPAKRNDNDADDRKPSKKAPVRKAAPKRRGY